VFDTIVKAKIEWHKTKELKFPYSLWRDVLLVMRTIDKVVAIDVVREELGKYNPPIRAKAFSFYYEIGKTDEENTKYLECIANELQGKLKPYIKKEFKCNEEVTVLL